VFLCGWMWRRQRPLLHPHHYPSSNRKIGIKRSLSNLGLCLRVTELPTNKSHLTNLMTVQG
jgi:hypothetical protein